MKNEQTITGTLRVIESLPCSYYGNPRYLVTINDFTYRTPVDSSLGYSIRNYDRKTVKAIVGIHYGKPTVRAVENI